MSEVHEIILTDEEIVDMRWVDERQILRVLAVRGMPVIGRFDIRLDLENYEYQKTPNFDRTTSYKWKKHAIIRN